MKNERWKQLSKDCSLNLTQEEIGLGWHFCDEFDGLLVGPESSELGCCHCWPKEHPVYLTTPKEEIPEINEGDL